MGRSCRSSGVRSETSARNGGVCTLVQKPVPAFSPTALHQMIGSAYTDARFLHTAVATGTGSTFVHVINLYCPSGNDRSVVDDREALLERVLFAAADSLGDVPIIVAGDLNTDEARSPTLRKALRNGWSDAARLQEVSTGQAPDATFATCSTPGTRIDRLMMNRVAAQAFSSCTTTIVDVPGHRLVTATFDLEAFDQTVWRYRLPRPIQVRPLQQQLATVEEDSARARQLLEQSRFAQAVGNSDVDEAWREWSATAERHLLDLCQVQTSERRRFTGRGRLLAPTRARATARSSSDGTGAASGVQLRLRNTIHRLEQLHRHLTNRGGPQSTPSQMQNCWKNCRKLASECAALRGKPMTAWDELPSLQECSSLLQAVRERNGAIGKASMEARRAKYFTGATKRADENRRSVVAWCRRQHRQEATTLEGERTTANAEEMDAVLQDAWDPVFRAYKDGPEPPYTPFAGRYQRYIDGHPQEVGEITGTELRALLTKKGVKGACGIDGWRMAELKALPDLYLESLATLLNLVERTGIWPQAMRTALVSMIPKGDDGQPLNMRPITVTSCVYRLWACRRLKDVAVWQESWVEEGQHGFRPGHRGEDPLFTMTLEIERALLSGEPLCGLSLDFSKCFDRVPREIALRLMQDLGLHSRILKPLKSIYDTLVRRFKLPLGVGKEFQVTNGILQGCPISVILINALLSVLMKAVKVEAPGVSTQSYADDANLLAKHSEADLQRGADLVDEFCALTGMSLNMEKTVTFATGLGRRTKIFRSSTGEQFAQKESLKCLGAKVSTSRSGRDHFDSSRFEAAATTARNLRHVPIPRQQKTLIVQSAILPAALARISFAPPTTEAVEKLATALTRAIWGPKNPKRSSEVVLGVLEKAHLTHPATATAYRITADFYSACGRLPHLMPLMTEVRRLYGERVTAALGPVGTAVRHGLQPCGHTWNGGPPSSVNLDGAALRPLAMSASSRNHIIRDNLRNRLWKRLETRRPSFSGITNIAIESTNALWTTRHCPPQNALLIRVALAGGVNTAEYTSRFRQGGSPACTLCGSGALEDEHHVYWDCTAFENIRTKPEYAGIAQSDRRLWPSCLREHGIVTPATREFAGPVQALMAEILAERARRISVRWLERKAATPWERCAQMPTAKREFPFRRIAPAWAWLRYWDEGTFLAAIDWLSGLEWSSDGDMAAVEAAIDFELFSGLDIKAPSKAAKTHREKANGMRCMLSAINKLAVQQQLGKCLPGDFKSKTTALSFIGLSSVPGFQPRPRHRMPETGPTIMQQVKTGYGTAPAYPPERTDRARRWVIPRAPLANPDPLHLPHAVPEATKNAPKCATHHKGKCAVCRALGHHHGPTTTPTTTLTSGRLRPAPHDEMRGVQHANSVLQGRPP
ncbi:putative RNA-directed DNA polymerase from transposon X-element [Diplonema papillatum]|nr:putative RNA-directed DNA polymerase from transposon X-element [Diplonema papillatum]